VGLFFFTMLTPTELCVIINVIEEGFNMNGETLYQMLRYVNKNQSAIEDSVDVSELNALFIKLRKHRDRGVNLESFQFGMTKFGGIYK